MIRRYHKQVVGSLFGIGLCLLLADGCGRYTATPVSNAVQTPGATQPVDQFRVMYYAILKRDKGAFVSSFSNDHDDSGVRTMLEDMFTAVVSACDLHKAVVDRFGQQGWSSLNSSGIHNGASIHIRVFTNEEGQRLSELVRVNGVACYADMEAFAAPVEADITNNGWRIVPTSIVPTGFTAGQFRDFCKAVAQLFTSYTTRVKAGEFRDPIQLREQLAPEFCAIGLSM
jgi:hypothetical protein